MKPNRNGNRRNIGQYEYTETTNKIQTPLNIVFKSILRFHHKYCNGHDLQE